MNQLANDWVTKTLGEVAKIQKGTTITSRTARPGSVPVIAGGKQPAYFHDEANRPAKTITVSASGAYAGFVAFHLSPIWASDCTTVEPNDEQVCLPDYLNYFMQSSQEEIYSLQRGSGMPHVYAKDLALLEIGVPTLDEQMQIVETLDDHLSRLDKALADLNNGLIASDVFTRSLLKAAFEGQLTISEEPSGWETTRIGDVVDFAPKKPNHLKASKEECSFLPMAAVQEVTGSIDLSQTISHEKALAKTLTFFNEGDVLFAKVTPCMENGKIAVARGLTNKMGYGSTEFHVLSPKETLLADYLRYFLVSKDFRVNAASAMTGAVGLRRVPKAYLEEHHIPLPGLDDQQKVVDTLDFQLSTVDQLKVSMYGHISKIAGLRRSLLHSAITGKLSEEGISE
jgi:restriction endonuclease S subunit